MGCVEQNNANMRKMRIQVILRMRKTSSGPCFPFILSTVSNDSVSEEWRPWSDCAVLMCPKTCFRRARPMLLIMMNIDWTSQQRPWYDCTTQQIFGILALKRGCNQSKLHVPKCVNLQNMYFDTSLIKSCQGLRELWAFDDFKMAYMSVAILNI